MLYDTNADAAKEAVDFVGNMLNRNVEKGRMAQEDAQAAIANIEVVDSLVDFAHCQIVIEAVVENIEIKNVTIFTWITRDKIFLPYKESLNFFRK